MSKLSRIVAGYIVGGLAVIALSLGTIERTNLVSNLLDAVGTPPTHSHRVGGDFPDIEDLNIVVTAAAGNTGDTTKIYPAAETVRGLPAVGASTNADTLASFSTRGFWVQIVAPGERIVSSIPGGRYAVWRGTSMSSPIVAGVAALIKAKYPTLDSDEIILHIRNGSVPIPNTMMRRIDAAMCLQPLPHIVP